jgi:ribosomal protein S3
MGQKTNASIFRLGLKNSEWKYKYIEKNAEESTIFLYKNIEIHNYIDTIFKHYNLLIHSCKIEYTYNTANILIFFYESNNSTFKFNSINSKKKDSLQQTFTTNKKLTSFLIKNVITPSLNLYIKNKIINVKTQNLNKKFETQLIKKKQYLFEYKKALKLLKNLLKTPWQKDLIKILFVSISEKNSSKLLADMISFCLNKQKKKHNYLLFILKKSLLLLIKLNFSKIKGIKIVITGRFNGVPRAKKKVLKIGIIPLQSFNAHVNYYNSVSYTPNGTFGVKVWVCEK